MIESLRHPLSKLRKKSPRRYTAVIGAASVDIHGYSYEKLRWGDSNPGWVKLSWGGVGRNIAENLHRLGSKVKLITLIAEDEGGRWFRRHCKEIGLDIRSSLVMKNRHGLSTPHYLSIMDRSREMAVALSGMDLFNNFTPDLIASRDGVLSSCEVLVMDTNLPEASLECLVRKYPQPIMVDAVSATKVKRISRFLPRLHTFKANRLEVESLLGRRLPASAIVKAARDLLSQGVKQVFITLGRKGMYYRDQSGGGFLKAPTVKPVGVTGAGDAAMAGIVAAYLRGEDIRGQAEFAQGVAVLTLMSEEAIHPTLSLSQVHAVINTLSEK